jgi:hypothetical protein
MRKTSILVLLVMNMLLASHAIAGEISHRQAAEKILSIGGMEQALVQSIEQMLNIQIRQKPSLVPYKEVMSKFLKKYMSYESLKDDIVAIYMEEFTEKELQEILAFYKTPTGRKTLEKMPQLMAKGAQLGVLRVQQNIGELQEMIRAESERIQKSQESSKDK